MRHLYPPFPSRASASLIVPSFSDVLLFLIKGSTSIGLKKRFLGVPWLANSKEGMLPLLPKSDLIKEFDL